METVQRIEAYKFVLKQFESNDPPTHICSELRTYHYEHIKEGGFDIFKYPELLAQKPFNKVVILAWFPFGNIESRKIALRNSINLAETTLYHETVKTAVNELGLETLPIPIRNCAKILHHMVTMNGISCQDRIKAGHRARIADLRHRHGLDSLIAKEHLTAVDEFGETYYYKRHYVKPEHVSEIVLAYLRINCPKEVKKMKSKVLEAMDQESV